MPAHRMSALQAAREIRAGRLTSLALVEDCLARIAARDGEIRAWTAVDAEGALAAARELDRHPARSILHGIPMGVKDVIDAAGLPTECQSPIYRGHRPGRDAAVVARARAAGIVILGKTVTTEFATRGETGPTRNPHDVRRSPGGSSSGSAAAVADCMVPLALSTQTAGSIVRPASYCAVVGFKPSFGALEAAGMKPVAPSFDTLGVHARSVADAAALYAVLAGAGASPPPAPAPVRSLRIGLYPGQSAGPASLAVLAEAARRLRAAGARVEPAELPAECEGLDASHDAVSDYEAWLSLAHEREHHAALLSQGVRAKLERGAAVGPAGHRRALARIRAGRHAAAALFERFDCLLAPSAPGPAPEFASRDTGSAACNKLWTTLGLPAINLPAGSAAGLPIGVQAVGDAGRDAALLQAALGMADVLARP